MLDIGKPFDEALADELLPLFTSMLLYMKTHKKKTWSYKTVKETTDLGNLAKPERKEKRYEVTVTVKQI